MNSIAAKTEGWPQQPERKVMARKKSYQHGTVEQHNGQWSLRYREFDHIKQEWTARRHLLGTFKNKTAARRAADPFMAGVNERNNTLNPAQIHAEVTFKAFIEGQWSDYKEKHHQEPTINCHNSLIKRHLMPFFGAKKMQEITPAEVTIFLGKCRKAMKPNSVLKIYAMLNLMFEIARQYDFIEQSPVRPMIHKPEVDEAEKATLNPKEIRTILAHLPRKERLFNFLLGVTGLRMGECFALRWMDFDEASHELRIAHTIYRGKLKKPKTASSKGKIRLHPFVVELLVSHREGVAFNAPTDFIFCRDDGTPLCHQSIRRHLQTAMDNAGIKRIPHHHGFHVYRHSVATMLYGQTGDLKPIQALLRHADDSMTEEYVHFDRQVVAEAGVPLAEVILGDLEANRDLFVTQESKMIS